MEWSLSTTEDKIKLNNAIEEARGSLIRIDDEKSFQNDVADRMLEELGVPKADFKKLVAERYKDKGSETIFKLQPLVELNEELIDLARKQKNG